MELIEITVKFTNAVNLEDSRLSKFVEISKKIGCTNVIINEKNRTCFDSMGNQIILNPQQFTFIANRPQEDNVEKIDQTNIDDISEFIELDSKTVAYVRLVDIERKEYDVYEKSIINSVPHINSEKGIGYRYLIDYKHGLSEFKAEPFINDKKTWFFETIINYNDFDDINKVKDLIKDSYNMFKENKKVFIESIES